MISPILGRPKNPYDWDRTRLVRLALRACFYCHLWFTIPGVHHEKSGWSHQSTLTARHDGLSQGLVLCMEPIAACLALGDRLSWKLDDKYLVRPMVYIGFGCCFRTPAEHRTPVLTDQKC